MRSNVIKHLILAVFVGMLSACGGGGSSNGTASTSTTTTTTTSNVQAIVVDAGPSTLTSPALNEVFTSVTICAPANPSLCQTIDHVLVDTGSSGLRLLSSVLSPAMSTALSAQSSGKTLVECTQFIDGYTWGPVRSVNMQIAGETASAMPMQVIGDPSFSSLVPRACSSSGPAENTVNTFGSNGLIGVGLFQQDADPTCAADVSCGINYYSCTSSSCAITAVNLAQLVPNPVSLFATDNNGVILSLPAVSGGTTSISGTMTFGVGTRSNNALGSATVFPMSASSGNFTTIYKSSSLTNSFIDSGSNGLYFPNLSAISTCTDGFYCPSPQLSLSATMVGSGSTTKIVNFPIANVDAALSGFPTYAVYEPLGAPNSDNTSFDWGLPFFFGRNVYVVTEAKTVGSNKGPFVAF